MTNYQTENNDVIQQNLNQDIGLNSKIIQSQNPNLSLHSKLTVPNHRHNHDLIPDPKCLRCEGTGYRMGKNGTNKICKSCSYQSFTQNTGQSNVKKQGSLPNLEFTPNQNCEKCEGTGYCIGKKGNNKICKKCAYQKTGQNNDNLGVIKQEDSHVKKDIKIIHDPNCERCQGAGYRIGKDGNIKKCKICSVSQKKESLKSNKENLLINNQNLEFQPNSNCGECNGTGYSIGTNNQLCKVCSTQTMGYMKIQTHLPILNSEIDFIPNPECKKCEGKGYRIGKKGISKTCKICLINQKKLEKIETKKEELVDKEIMNNNKISNQIVQNTGYTKEDHQQNFIPNQNCIECVGTGFKVGKFNEICNVCPSNQNSGQTTNLQSLPHQFFVIKPNPSCPECVGTGRRIGGDNELCMSCSGNSSKRKTLSSGINIDCSDCGGTGSKPAKSGICSSKHSTKCKKCDGYGKIESELQKIH